MKFKTDQVLCDLHSVVFSRVVNVQEQGEKGHYFAFARSIDRYTKKTNKQTIFFSRTTRKNELYFGPIELFQARRPPPKKGDVIVGVATAADKGTQYEWWYSDGTVPAMLNFTHALLQHSFPKKNSRACFEALKRTDDPYKEDEWWALYLLFRGNVNDFVHNNIRHPSRMDESGYQHDTGFRLGKPLGEFVWIAAYLWDREIHRQFTSLGGNTMGRLLL